MKMGDRARLRNGPPLHKLGLKVGMENISTYYVGMVGQRDDGEKWGVNTLRAKGVSLYSLNRIMKKGIRIF